MPRHLHLRLATHKVRSILAMNITLFVFEKYDAQICVSCEGISSSDLP